MECGVTGHGLNHWATTQAPGETAFETINQSGKGAFIIWQLHLHVTEIGKNNIKFPFNLPIFVLPCCIFNVTDQG